MGFRCLSASCFALVVLFLCNCATAQELKRNDDMTWSQLMQSLNQSEEDARTALQRFQEEQFRLLIEPGNPTDADAYYARISELLGDFDFANSNLNGLIAFLGYSESSNDAFLGLQASDLEEIPSFELMPRTEAEFENLKTRSEARTGNENGFQQAGLSLESFQRDEEFGQQRIIVSRFFAPKIVTYFNQENDATARLESFEPILRDDIQRQNGAGWRKVVRLTALQGSDARNAGIKHAYILFNFKKKNPFEDPYLVSDSNPSELNVSGNNQVILVPVDQNADGGDSCYFAVYDSKTNGYGISKFLVADFDLPFHAKGFQGKYFVPQSCAQCHGHSGPDADSVDLLGFPVDANGKKTTNFTVGTYPHVKPNYLDTDQWYDWMDYDYRELRGSLNDVLFDGTRDHGSDKYKRAFEAVWNLNKVVDRETLAAEKDANVPSFQSLASKKWLELHSSTDESDRKPISQRSIGEDSWKTSSQSDMRLLSLLNNHCFRCHSSVRFNVFDRKKIKELAPFAVYKLTTRQAQVFTNDDGEIVRDESGNAIKVPLPGYLMPQGRVLLDKERNELIDLLTKLSEEN